MTEDLTWCVRGCSRPCRCDEYLVTGTCDHELRIVADVGYLCGRCSERLEQAVHEIPDLWTALPGLYDTGHSDQFAEKVTHGKVTGSPARIRHDAMVLGATAFDRKGSTAAYEGDGVMPVMPTIAGWVDIIEEDLGLKPQGDSLTAWCSLLRTWHKRICSQPWVDKYWRDLIAVHRALRHATGSGAPIGRCWGRVKNRADGGCGRMLYAPPPGVETVTCPNDRCGRTYDGPELIKLAIQGEREGIA